MELLTAELCEKIPPLYSQENIEPKQQTVHCKFFHPISDWTWFVTEGQQENGDYIFFGYVIGFAEEWGYFSLSELLSVSPEFPPVERDDNFTPDTFENVIANFRRQRGE